LRNMRFERCKRIPLPPCTTRNQHGNSKAQIKNIIFCKGISKTKNGKAL
jgi:hypothetical protein